MTGRELHSTPIYSEIRRRLEEVRGRYYVERVIYGCMLTTSIFLGLISLSAIAEAVLNGGTSLRATLFFGGMSCLVFLGVRFVIVPLLRWRGILRSITEKELAEAVGRKFPEIKDRLRNILEIFEERGSDRCAGFRPEYSAALVDASFADLQQASSGLTFTDVVSFAKVRRGGKYLSLAFLLTICVFAVPQFELTSATYRLLHFRTEFHPPQAFTLLVHPGNIEVVRGESVPVSVSLLPNPLPNNGSNTHLRTALPAAVTLEFGQLGIGSPERVEVKADSTGQFRRVIPSLKQPFEYAFEAGDARSETYTIEVVDRPRVRSLRVHLTPPAYAHLAALSLDENVGDATGLPGTIVNWQIRASKEVRRASIVLNDGRRIALRHHEQGLAAEFVLSNRASYHVDLEDTEGFFSTNPIEYKLDILADETPTVAVEYPGKNVDIANEMQLPLRLKIHDDYGFTSLRIAYRLVHSQYEKPHQDFSLVPIPLADNMRRSGDAEVNFLWDVSPLGLVPEDVIEYHAEVFDNDNISGPKKGVSDSYLLRLPSLDEVFADAERNQHEAIQKLDESLQEAEELRKNLNAVSQELKKNQPLDWQQQKKAEETLKRYQELTKNIEDVSKAVDAMAQEMQKNNILSSETIQKYMELQKLLQEINSPEFQEAMKRMQQAIQSISPEQLRQAMQQVQFSEEAFRQSIERTMELLKRIQVEQKVDELVKRSNELFEHQEKLRNETASTDSSDRRKTEDLARKQEDISRELAEMQNQLAELRNKMEEFPKDMPMKELSRAEAAAHDSSMEHAAEESSRQLRQSRKQQALEGQQEASKGMQHMSQRFSEMQEQMLSNQMTETMNALRKAMKDLLEISQREEELKNRSQSFEPNSPQFRENAQQQLNLQGDLANVTNDLVELSQKSFAVTPEMGRAIGKAMGSMTQAMSGLEQRNGAQASAQQGEAMASLNKTASLVQSSMDAMMQGGQGGGAGSLLQQLRHLAGQQQSINVQTEQLEGQGLGQRQLEELGRLAKQQEAVRKSLEQLNKEAKEGSDRNRILGDLQKIADEMKEVVENLQQNNVNPNTIRQQQRILSRLLDAQTSMRERDYEQRRKSMAGTSPMRRSPSELKTDSGSDRLRYDLQKAAEEGYSRDYQDLIRKYYEALSRTETK